MPKSIGNHFYIVLLCYTSTGYVIVRQIPDKWNILLRSFHTAHHTHIWKSIYIFMSNLYEHFLLYDFSSIFEPFCLLHAMRRVYILFLWRLINIMPKKYMGLNFWAETGYLARSYQLRHIKNIKINLLTNFQQAQKNTVFLVFPLHFNI